MQQRVADHLVGDRVDLGVRVAVQPEPAADAQLGRRDVAVSDSVPEARLARGRRLGESGGDLISGGHARSLQPIERTKLPIASSVTWLPAATATVVFGSSTTAGPFTRLPGLSAPPSCTAVGTQACSSGQ